MSTTLTAATLADAAVLTNTQDASPVPSEPKKALIKTPGMAAINYLLRASDGQGESTKSFLWGVTLVAAVPFLAFDVVLVTCIVLGKINEYSRKLDRVVGRVGLFFPIVTIMVLTAIGTASFLKPMPVANASEPAAATAPSADGAAEGN